MAPWHLVSLFLGLFLVLPAGSSGAESPRGQELTFQTVSGGSLKLSDYRGKLVLVNFWATWCPPCLEEIPALVRFQSAFADKGVVVIGANYMEKPDPKRLRTFKQDHGINYPIAYGAPLKMQTLARSLGGVFGLPVTKLLNREGKVVSSKTGGMTEKEMRRWVEPFLTEKGTKP